MNERHDEKLCELLREALPPMAECEVKRDLWPQMLHRFDRQKVRLSWFDWALVAALMVWLWFFPEAAAALLYQL